MAAKKRGRGGTKRPAAMTDRPAPPSPPPGVRTARQEQREAQQRARRRRRLGRRAGLTAIAVLAVVGIVAYNAAGQRRHQRTVAQLTAGTCALDERSDSGRDHTSSPTYRVNPPSGGDHEPSAAPPGVFSGDDLPSDGTVVHALEHGYVALWYRPDLPEGEVTRLGDLADRHDRDLLIERQGLGQAVAATAWHRRLLCPKLETKALDRFITAYRNKGPERVPH